MLIATVPIWLPAVLWMIAIAALAAAYRPLRGTTLRAVWWWSLLAITAAAVVEAAIGAAADSGRWGERLRLIAGVGTFCPLVALLGAKRPQATWAWQWVVASFWVMLAFPAAEVYPGGQMLVHPLQSWFLLVLIAVGVSNYLPTRFGLAGAIFGCGQALYLCQILPWRLGQEPIGWAPITGLGLIAAAAVLACFNSRRRTDAREPLDRLWRDFRDQFGVVWALRIAERINASAKMYDWKTSLGWQGFAPDVEPPARADVEQALRTLLRRFVSPQWIDSRMAKPADK